jgi:hypothetical protein
MWTNGSTDWHDTSEEAAMLVRQPSYTWVGVLIGVVVIIVLMLGANIGGSELLNPVRARVTAEAASAMLTQQAQDRQRMIHATENAEARAATATAASATQIALDNERRIQATAIAGSATQAAQDNERRHQATAMANAQIATAQAAQATRTAEKRDVFTPTPMNIMQASGITPIEGATNKNSQDFKAIGIEALVLLIAIIVIALVGLIGAVVVLQYRMTLAEAEAARLQQAARVTEAEALRYERQAEMLREQRRTAQATMAIRSNTRQNGQKNADSTMTHASSDNQVTVIPEEEESLSLRY